MMVISPLVERELQRALRKRWPYRVRMTAAITSFLLASFAYSAPHAFSSVSASGRWLFFTLSTSAFFLCILSGPFLTSFALREEKQTGMLDLLLLSRVGPLGILVSKLLTYSNPAIQTLLGILPALTIPLLIGGVSSAELVRMSLLCLVSLGFSSMIGIFSAAFCRSGSGAFILSLFLVLGFTLGTFGIDRQLSGTHDLFLLSGPLQALATASDLAQPKAPFTFATSIASLAILTLGLACLTLRTLARVPSQSTQRSARTATAVSAQPRSRRKEYRRIRSNPATWIAERRQWRPLTGSLLIMGSMIAIAIAYSYQPWFPVPTSHLHLILYPLAAHGVFKLMLAAKTIQLLIDCRRTGEMEILLSTPIRGGQIYYGFRTAVLKGFRKILGLVLVTDAATLILSTALLSSPGRDQILWLLVWGMIVMLAVDVWALTWIGSWEGVRSLKPIDAYAKTIRNAVVIPFIAFVATIGFSPFLLINARTLGNESVLVGAIIWWWIIGFVIKACFAFASKRALSNRFRHTLATVPL